MIALMTPLKFEFDAITGSLPGEGRIVSDLNVPHGYWNNLGLVVVQSGKGKVQTSLSALHTYQVLKPTLFVGLGSAGALANQLGAGDLVVAENIIEYDFKAKFGSSKGRPPKFACDQTRIERLKEYVSSRSDDLNLQFGDIASGDEDIIELNDRQALFEMSGALAASWEPAGLARAARFSQTPHIEIRCITDTSENLSKAELIAQLKNTSLQILNLVHQLGGD